MSRRSLSLQYRIDFYNSIGAATSLEVWQSPSSCATLAINLKHCLSIGCPSECHVVNHYSSLQYHKNVAFNPKHCNSVACWKMPATDCSSIQLLWQLIRSCSLFNQMRGNVRLHVIVACFSSFSNCSWSTTSLDWIWCVLRYTTDVTMPFFSRTNAFFLPFIFDWQGYTYQLLKYCRISSRSTLSVFYLMF